MSLASTYARCDNQEAVPLRPPFKKQIVIQQGRGLLGDRLQIYSFFQTHHIFEPRLHFSWKAPARQRIMGILGPDHFCPMRDSSNSWSMAWVTIELARTLLYLHRCLRLSLSISASFLSGIRSTLSCESVPWLVMFENMAYKKCSIYCCLIHSKMIE